MWSPRGQLSQVIRPDITPFPIGEIKEKHRHEASLRDYHTREACLTTAISLSIWALIPLVRRVNGGLSSRLITELHLPKKTVLHPGNTDAGVTRLPMTAQVTEVTAVGADAGPVMSPII